MFDTLDLRAWHRRIVSGQSGLWAAPVRWAMGRLSRVYSWGVAARNRAFDCRGAAARLSVPVISVGNIIAGGTGKTPLVIDITGRLIERGRKPAVISRGYRGGPDGLNDEHQLIQRHCPQAICLSDPDRVRGGQLAIQRDGADVIVLDDAFQHRRIHRDFDIVLIDATCPFGFDRLLPRGLLREPPWQLRRADIIVITRVDQVSPGDLAVIANRIRHYAAGTQILKCRHRPVSVSTLKTGVAPVLDPCGTSLEGKQVVCFAGVGNPEAFEATVASMGAEVVGRKWWPDHHRYHPKDMDELLRAGRFPDFDLLVTTEKDAVKLTPLAPLPHPQIAVVGVKIELLDGGATILAARLDELLGTD